MTAHTQDHLLRPSPCVSTTQDSFKRTALQNAPLSLTSQSPGTEQLLPELLAADAHLEPQRTKGCVSGRTRAQGYARPRSLSRCLSRRQTAQLVLPLHIPLPSLYSCCPPPTPRNTSPPKVNINYLQALKSSFYLLFSQKKCIIALCP